MPGKQYRLSSSTLAILTRDDQQKIPITIPQGAIVEVLAGINGKRLIDVVWEGKTVAMFTIDLRNRGVSFDPQCAIISS